MKIKILFILALLLTMTQGAWAQDELGGEFSVSAVKKVHFSRGNLRATTSNLGANWTWTFAEHQWDYVGNAASNTSINGNGTVSTNGTVDLFGFSTETTYYGIHNSNNNGTFSNAFKDWGEIIGTGWYTPSQDEWTYLLNTRSGSTVGATANARYTYATINTDATGVKGLMLFPDGVTFAASEATSWGTINGKSAWNSATKCSAAQWTALEAKGCVFLPAAGNRNGTTINNVGASGYYRTSTVYDDNSAYRRLFGEDNDTDPYGGRFRGYAVRLVKEITYNVTRDATMSEGWTIDPAGPVAEGAAVTATYSGSRHVKSVSYRPTGTIGGQFTINGSGDKVYFSQGNLQYIGSAATPYWKFAENQWDYLGTSTGQNSSATNVNRDLFGWGTKTDPYKTSNESTSYSWNEWGENAITNGGNRINSGWRTLESTEWAYLWNGRDNAANLRTLATVNNVTGLILMPDGWTASGVALTVTTADYTTNNINSADWNTLEQQGCVFLPAAGWRDGTNVQYLTTHLCYYSSTISGSDCAYRIAIAPNSIYVPNVLYRQYGCSVRLVKAVSSVELTPNGDKTEWTITMPDYDIELSAEYYDEVTLTDGEAITALNTYTGQEIWVNYTRSFTAGKPSTVCLPFAYTPQGEEKFYSFTGINEDDGNYTADMTEVVSPLVANTPYLFMPTGNADFSGTYAIPASIEAGTTTSGDWKFKGTYSTINWTEAPTGIYGFSAQAANDGIQQGQFVKVGSYVRIKPMRAYLQYSGSDSQFINARSLTRAAATTSDDTLPETIGVRLISANGEVTAIGTLYTRTGEVSFDSEAWYTLDGKRLNAKPNTKGIYVNNGKKVVIK